MSLSQPTSCGILGLACILTGCVLSIEPVVPATAAIFDLRLLGTWEEVGGKDIAVVTQAPDHEDLYRIEYTAGGSTSRFDGRLGRLGDRLVLDVWPAPGDGDLPSAYSSTLLAGHLLVALDLGTDEVRVARLEPDPLAAALRAGPAVLTHRRSGDDLVLQGTTGELRSALSAHLARPGALTDAGVWRRARRPRVAPPRPVDVPCFEASAWREADALFRRDPRWRGADVASSVDLGDGRTLWLFGDTWIDPSGQGTRHGARMVSNSVAIQTGRDPAAASIDFYWGRSDAGAPAAFFPDRGDEALWPGNGVRVDDRLVLFFSRTVRTGTGIGFRNAGWTAVLVENPDSAPSAWRVRPLDSPTNILGVVVGYAGVLRLGDHVYAFGTQDPIKSHPVFAARWPAERVRSGDLHRPEWWAGERLGWVADSSSAARWPLFENGQSELSIHVDPGTGRFLAVHTVGLGPADLLMRAAPALTGPWSRPNVVYRPSEYYRPDIMVYAGKAHPHLAGADLVLTYATNSMRSGLEVGEDLYYPRFVWLARCP